MPIGREVPAYFPSASSAPVRVDRLSDAHLLELVEGEAGFGVWECDPAGRSIFLSVSAARLCGWTPVSAQTSIADLLQRVHPDDRASVETAALAATEHTTGFRCDLRILQPDGSYLWRRCSAHLRIAEGEPSRMVGAISDIHEERLRLERLDQAAARMSLAEDVAGFGVWEMDLHTATMTLSAGAAALSGFERRSMQVHADDVSAKVHPEDLQRVNEVVERAIREGTPYRVDCRVMLPDGELRWIRSQARVEVHDGKPVRITGAIIDITRERVLLDQLRESAERMRLAEEAAGFGVWESDRRAESVTVSQGMLRLHELPSDAPLTYTSREIATMLDADYIAALKRATDASFQTGESFQIEVPIRSRDGSTRWRRIQARPEYQNGKPWRLIGATLDITGEQEMRRSLEQARAKAEAAARAKSEFLANMSHEIRTPLNGVMGMTQLLLDSPLTAQQRDWVETAMGSGTALLSIINDILDFSKIEAGKLAIDVLSFDLRRLLEEVAGILAPKADGKGIDLMVRYSPGTPVHLVGDADRIRQVVLNLANNAIKFTETGHVLIAAEAVEQDAVGATIRIAVTDTGIGIPPYAIDTLFNEFTQADSSTTRRYGGTGLGLAISRRLVELMRGSIHVESQEGQGSTFEFRLRLPLGNHLESVTAMPASLRGVRALIVVDNGVNRGVIHEQLVSWGLRDGSCATSREALDALREAHRSGDPYQIVIADQNVPPVDGMTLPAALRRDRESRDVVYVMLTSIGKLIDHDALPEMGIDACVVKPVRHARLINTLAAAWTRRRSAGTEGTDAAARVQPPRTCAADLPQFSARVLVVEDNIVNQKVAAALLTRLGVHADVANDGREAVERLQAQSYDLVLMDCQMPVMNGYDATIAIRRQEIDTRIPIIAMTADVIDGSKERAFEAGMDDFVAKPVDMQDLSRALRTWLRKAA